MANMDFPSQDWWNRSWGDGQDPWSGTGDFPYLDPNGPTSGGFGYGPRFGRRSLHYNPPSGPNAPTPPRASTPQDLLMQIIQRLTSGRTGAGTYGMGGTGPGSSYGVTPGGYLAELQRITAPPTPPSNSPSSQPTPAPSHPSVAAAKSAGSPTSPPSPLPLAPPMSTRDNPSGGDSGPSYYPPSDNNSYNNSGGNSGVDSAAFMSYFGPFLAAGGAYLSNRQNAKNAAAGPVLPADVQASRAFLGQLFLKMLSTPGGLDFGPPPFALNIGETDPYAAVNKYRESSAPAFQTELNTSLDTERAKLGGQYGIRFGTDLQRGLGDTLTNVTNAREAKLGELGVSSYDSYMNRRLAELSGRIGDYRQQQSGYLPLITNYLSGQPSSSPFAGGSPFGQGLQALGGGLANASLYKYLNG